MAEPRHVELQASKNVTGAAGEHGVPRGVKNKEERRENGVSGGEDGDPNKEQH